MTSHGLNGAATIAALFDASGCDACNQTGYRGRLGLYRWFPVSPDAARAIHARATDAELESLAISHGWPAIAGDATRHLIDGNTSLGEVLRVVTL